MQHSDPPVKWVDISPELAEEWLGKNHGNRNQRDHKIIAYTRDIKDGNWLQTGETIKFDTDGRLIDGQHRLEAIHRSGETLRMLVVMGLSPHVQSVLDAAHEFWSSVAEMRTRGVGDPRFTMIKTFKKIDELGKQKTTALQLSIIFRAWNAWREGRSLTKLPMEAGGKSVTLSDPK